MDNTLSIFQDACKLYCLSRVSCLDGIVAGVLEDHPSWNMGAVLCGSGATPELFTPSSDLDMMLISENLDEMIAVSIEMHDEWKTATSNVPELNINMLHAALPSDPYLRVSTWLGPENYSLKLKITKSLKNSICKRAHVFEALCEDFSARMSINPKKRINIRTHPDGLRALWQMKFLCDNLPGDNVHDNQGWLTRLFDHCGMERKKTEFASRLISQLRMARSIIFSNAFLLHTGYPSDSTLISDINRKSVAYRNYFIQEIASENCCHTLGAYASEVYRACAQENGIDIQRLKSFLVESESQRISESRREGDSAIFLSWCDTSHKVLEAIADNHLSNDQIRMGLAFNRATPGTIIRTMINAPLWLENRPLLRQRCYTHKSVRSLPAEARRQFLDVALEKERVPKLRKTLSSMMGG